MRRTMIAAACAACLTAGTQAMAEEEKRQLGAHVHGHGKVNIAVEGNKMAMEVKTPAWDIIGFGHKPSTDKQKELLKAAKKSLLDEPLSLFALPKEADCKLVSSKLDHKQKKHKGEHKEENHHDDHKGEHKEEKEHKDHHDDHKDEHKDEHHKGHKDEHKDHKHGKKEGKHANFHAKYELECKSPAKLTTINFANWFKRFTNSKELDVTALTATSQKSYEVTPKSPVLKGLSK